MFLKNMKKSNAGKMLLNVILVIVGIFALAIGFTPYLGGSNEWPKSNVDLANAKVMDDILKRYVDENGSLPAEPSAEIKKQISFIPTVQQKGKIFVLHKDICTVTISKSVDGTKNEVQIKD